MQRGLIGALRLVPPEAGVVLPHEDVVPGPVRGRRQLMEATQANLEPIFLLYDGGQPGAATRLVEDVAAGRAPLAEACPWTGCGTGSGRSPTRPSSPPWPPTWRRGRR